MALADPVRRSIIARLSRGPATVNELAEPFAITKQAVSKHIQVLEQAQLVTRTRDAQRRPVHLNPARLEALTAWIDQYRLVREGQFRSLDAVLQITCAPRQRQTCKGPIMSNSLKLSVPEGLPFIDYEREFDFPGRGRFPRPQGTGPDRPVAGPAGTEDGHRPLRLPHRRQLQLPAHRTGRRRLTNSAASSTRSEKTSSPSRPSNSAATRTLSASNS